MEEIKDKIFTVSATKEIIRSIKNTITVLESLLEIEIEFKIIKKKKEITSIELRF